MAKSVDLLFLLLGSFIFIYHGNNELHVNQPTDLSVNHAAVNSMEEKVRDSLQHIYSQEIGVREKSNKNDGKRIGEYLKYTGLSEGYAWCAAFISWCFNETGLKEPKTAWSPSLFPNDRTIWKRDGGVVIKNGVASLPKRGDVFGIYFSSFKRIAHAGFVDEWGDKFVITVEGNTNDAGGRDGDGVYRKRRPINSIYRVANWIN